jgi:NHL repeat
VARPAPEDGSNPELLERCRDPARHSLVAGGGANGSADGTGSAAQFDFAWGIVMGGDGNLYVADQRNSTIRKVTPAGVVRTTVGTAAMPLGIAPGGLPARLGSPFDLALLSNGPSVSLAVADEWERVVLRVDLP